MSKVQSRPGFVLRGASVTIWQNVLAKDDRDLTAVAHEVSA